MTLLPTIVTHFTYAVRQFSAVEFRLSAFGCLAGVVHADGWFDGRPCLGLARRHARSVRPSLDSARFRGANVGLYQFPSKAARFRRRE